MTEGRVVAALPDVRFADGSRSAVDLVLTTSPAPDGEVFAALVLLQDRADRCAVVYSPRRQEWASPGGGREDGEAVTETVVREVLEETGLRVDEGELEPCGYERFRPITRGRWPVGGGCLQVYRLRLDAAAPPLAVQADDVIDSRWVTPAEFEELCGSAFWWPLAAALLTP